MTKSEALSHLLERRIALGDYLGHQLPSERVLAAQEGVGYMTAREAIRLLIARGILSRGDNGRLMVAPDRTSPQRPRQIALIIPAFPSADVLRWRLALDGLCASGRGGVKTIHYLHWHDPQIIAAVEQSDGAFIYPDSERIPPAVLRRITAHRGVVVLDQDFSALGIPSLRLVPSGAVHLLLDHLVALGHRSVACLHVQPDGAPEDERIRAWRDWQRERGVGGTFLDFPVRPGDAALDAAYTVMSQQAVTDTAFFATTADGALGALRALHERGFIPGRDVAVCTLNDEGRGAFTIPSLTAIALPDPRGYLARCLAWMSTQDAPWQGPLLLQPDVVQLAVRESTAGIDAPKNCRV